jgi:hypothetical protein
VVYTNPELRKRILARIRAGSKGGRPGQWSARKAQLLSQAYEKAGGGYSGSKTKSQQSLSKWTREEWGTKSGKPSTQGKNATGERYLPKKAIQNMSPSQYAATTAAKRAGTKAGKQFVPQPPSVARKAAKYR